MQSETGLRRSSGSQSMSRNRVWNLALIATVLIASAFAQEFRATLNGRVTDATGSGVPDAKVTATNVQTNEAASATTGGDGDYTIPFLKPGVYNVRAEVTGFKSAVQE